MLYCTNCGTRRAEGASYCYNCGRLLDSGRPRAGPAAVGPETKWGAVPWRGGQVALGILLIAISFIAVIAIAIGVDRILDRYEEATVAWVSVHVMALAIVAVVWRLGVYRSGSRLSILGLIPMGRPSLKTAIMTVVALGASLGFTAVYATLVGLVDADLLSPPDVPSEIVFPGLAALFTFQALAVVTPITEEIFFRGFVFSGLVHRLGVGRAILASAVLFSAFHLSLGVLVPVIVTGLLLGWLYYRTGSLWPSILVHAGQNALAVAIEVYWG